MSIQTNPVIYIILSVLFVSGVLTACGGGSGGSGAAPPPNPPPQTPPFSANFSEIQANVFTTTCAVSGCHSGAGAPQGLRLDAANSYALLVGVASNEVPSIQRVAPSDPNNSYLVQKLEGTAAVGGRMPLNGQPLAQATIDIIRQWITDGAIDDRVPASTPIRITSLTPATGALLTAAPADIRVAFDRDVDASTVNVNTFLLEASGGDGTFDDGNESQIAAASVSVPAANSASAIFDLTGTNLADDTYRVRLLGDGSSTVLDLDANRLDGEFTSTFPSGNGTQGGDFEATFSVATPVQMSPTLDQIQAQVLGPTCGTSFCHSGTGATLPSSMDLTSADASFASLVGVQSLQDMNFLRVEGGNPNGSYLVQKLEGTASAGARMPFGGGALDPAMIAEIRQWITDGAQR